MTRRHLSLALFAVMCMGLFMLSASLAMAATECECALWHCHILGCHDCNQTDCPCGCDCACDPCAVDTCECGGDDCTGHCGRPCDLDELCIGKTGCPCSGGSCTNCDEICSRATTAECEVSRSSSTSTDWHGGTTGYACACGGDGCPNDDGSCLITYCSTATSPPTLWSCGYGDEPFYLALCDSWMFIGCVGAGCVCPDFCPSGLPACDIPPLPCATSGCNGNDCGCGDYCTAAGTPCGL